MRTYLLSATLLLGACDAGEKTPPQVEIASKVEVAPKVEPVKRTDARLHGKITARDGRPLNARVVIRNNETMVAGERSNNLDGTYDLIKITPGAYTLIIDYYVGWHERQVVLRAGDDLTVDIQLDVP